MDNNKNCTKVFLEVTIYAPVRDHTMEPYYNILLLFSLIETCNKHTIEHRECIEFNNMARVPESNGSCHSTVLTDCVCIQATCNHAVLYFHTRVTYLQSHM